VGPFWLPTINTALLLTSGVTLTIAHHALRENQRGKTIAFMWATVLLGSVPVRSGLRVLPPLHRLEPEVVVCVFGSTFFMLTGFHGFHVFIGMLMLLFITLRLQKGHFTADKHFGFEGAAGTGTLWTWSGSVCTSSCIDVSADSQQKSAARRLFCGLACLAECQSRLRFCERDAFSA
jgi:heme/copper-type cytochrome/quinol oxidase subunit 3